MLKLVLLLVAIAVLGVNSVIQCHVCKTHKDQDCTNITKHDNKFLENCLETMTKCVTKFDSPGVVIRRCGDPTWECSPSPYYCETCDKDGCNNRNTGGNSKTLIAGPSKLPNPFWFLVRANSWLIGISVFLLTLTIVWVAIRLNSRRKRNAYDEDECDYDEDSVEYYENEL